MECHLGYVHGTYPGSDGVIFMKINYKFLFIVSTYFTDFGSWSFILKVLFLVDRMTCELSVIFLYAVHYHCSRKHCIEIDMPAQTPTEKFYGSLTLQF